MGLAERYGQTYGASVCMLSKENRRRAISVCVGVGRVQAEQGVRVSQCEDDVRGKPAPPFSYASYHHRIPPTHLFSKYEHHNDRGSN